MDLKIPLLIYLILGPLTLATYAQTPPPIPPADRWTLVEGKHWQKKSAGPVETPEETDRREGNRGSCQSPGMVRVQGNMVVSRSTGADSDEVGALQDLACTSWISNTFPKRCARFDAAALRQKLQKLPRRRMAFCMDRFEYPNQKGANPIIMMTFPEATALCRAKGKRLCSDEEWTFACEGEEALPYPYGYERSSQCNADSKDYVSFAGALKKIRKERERLAAYAQSHGDPPWSSNGGEQCIDSEFFRDLQKQIAALASLANASAYQIQVALSLILERKRFSPEAAEILDALWAGEPSGSRAACKSASGIYDLTGNIDEWTNNRISGGKYHGAQKGGYWGPVRARCRPATVAHSEGHFFYQQGTRCCSDN